MDFHFAKILRPLSLPQCYTEILKYFSELNSRTASSQNLIIDFILNQLFIFLNRILIQEEMIKTSINREILIMEKFMLKI